MFRVTVDLGPLRNAEVRVRGRIIAACKDATRYAAEQGRDEAKRVGAWTDRSGGLRASIQANPADDTHWEIVASARHARFIEEGTRPHQIEAKRGGRLSFFWERRGVWFHGRRVNHPGTRPYPYMGPAYIKAEAALRARLETLLDALALREAK